MNEEQRAVLATVHRLEESRGGPIDEYTVARGAGLLQTDLSGQEYILRPERERIRQLFGELEDLGFLRLDRTGYWRPRTTLAGRRALQQPPQAFAPAHPRSLPPTTAEPARETEDEEVEKAATWPAWWPVALRVGDNPTVAPLLTAIAGVGLVLLVFVVVLATRSRATTQATPTLRVVTPFTQGGGATSGSPTPDYAATPVTTAALATAPPPVTPTPEFTPTLIPPVPTATPRENPPLLIVANTNNQGAYLFATPNGERRFAVSEGTALQDIGPDEKDTQGRVWKHVRLPDYNNFEGWILAEYTAPAP